MISRTHLLGLGALTASALLLPAAAQAQQSVEQFYKGRNVAVIVGNNAGGAYDAYARLLVRHMGRHIPGNPSFVVRNMTGAGTLIATNYLFNVAPKDGSTFGGVHERMGLEPKVAPEGTKYDGREFVWLGSMAKQISVCLTWHTTGIKTVEDATKREVIAGGSGVAGSSAVFPRVMNNILGTRFKLVIGYGGTDTDIALERGEVDSRCGFGWASLKATKPEWIRDNKVNIITQFGLKKHKELPDVPLIMDLITKPEDRLAMEVMLATQEMGRPFMAPPRIPADRAAALRKAFMAAVTDPALLAEAQKMDLEIDPISGEEIQALLVRLYDAPDHIYARVNAYRQPGSGEGVLKAQEQTVKAQIVNLINEGREFEFTFDGDKKDKAKTSNSRTKIVVAGKEGKRTDLKQGMTCDITYAGTDSDATLINCP